TWHKPELGLVRYHDSRANNLVNLPTCEGTVFRDPTPESPNARYVYVASICTEGIVRFHSPDGLNWRRDARPLLPFRADTQNVVFRDPRCGNYVLYLRGW